jgi:hypothetical protein
MPAPLRLFIRSLQQFAIGLAPALVLAFICLTIQVVLGTLAVKAWDAVFPPEPFSVDRIFEPEDWRDTAADGIVSIVLSSVVFFFHVLVVMIVTAGLLRRPSGLDAVILRRAVRGAGILTAIAAAVFLTVDMLPFLIPAVARLHVDLSAIAMLGIWFGFTALLLPARLLGYQPAAASGFRKTTSVTAIAVLPWFLISELVGKPLRNCYECWGFFEGGLFTYPLLGAYLLGLTVSCAAVSAAACMSSPDLDSRDREQLPRVPPRTEAVLYQV